MSHDNIEWQELNWPTKSIQDKGGSENSFTNIYNICLYWKKVRYIDE